MKFPLHPLIKLININKHLTTGPKGNNEFCFPKTLNISWGKVEGNINIIEVKEKQNSLFPTGHRKEIVYFTPAGSQICHGFKE